MRSPLVRTIGTVLVVAMAAWWIGANAYASAPVVATADCDTVTVQIGEDIPAPRIPILYVTKVAVADGDRTWELSAGDVLTVDRSWPGSAWAVWVHGDLVASGERDHSCEWDYDIVVDTDQAPSYLQNQGDSAVMVEPIVPATVPAGIRWF